MYIERSICQSYGLAVPVERRLFTSQWRW